MKQTDFDRLKAVCEKEGFELMNLTHDDNEKYVLVKKQKDIWEGVEFYRSKWSKSIYNINRIDLKLREGIKLMDWEPSTEQAYIEQLKAEAFKRFGEIKEGEKFQMADGGIYKFGKTGNIEWDYFKKVDQFFHYNVELYCEGKWATRVKERIKVEFLDFDYQIEQFMIPKVKFQFWMNPVGDLNDAGEFIASKLEEYLNKE